MAAELSDADVFGTTPGEMTDAQVFSNSPPVQHPVAVATGDIGTDAGRFAGTVGANALAGLLSMPNTVAQGVDWLGRRVGINVGAQQAVESVRDPSDPSRPLLPDFPTAREMAFQTTGGTEYQPQTWLGRRGMDAATAAALAVTNPRAIPAALGAGAAGGAAAEMVPEYPFLAALIGGSIGSGLTRGAINTAQRTGAAIAGGPAAEPYAAFERQGLPTELVGTTTGDPGMLWLEKFGARMPGSEGAMADARGRLLSAWQDRLQQVGDSLGTATTPAEAGQALQADAGRWLTDFKNTTGQLWTDFKSKVPGTASTPVGNYQQTLTDLLGTYPGAPATAGVLRPGTVKALSDALGVDLQGGTSLPWDAVQNIRTAIGEKLENPSTIADTSQASLRRLYGALSDDMKAGAASVSPDALTAFHRANAATAAGHDLLDGYLNPILKAASPEDATQYAMAQARRGGDRLGAITFNLPSAAGELSSYALRNLATNTESPTSFATGLEGRRPAYSPEAQNVLFPDPGTQSAMADLAETGRRMMPVEKDLANSPTSTHQTRGLGRVISAVELARQGRDVAGMPGAIAGFGAGMFSPEIMGRAAQWTSVNPLLASAYGRQLPFELGGLTPWNRMLISNTVSNR